MAATLSPTRREAPATPPTRQAGANPPLTSEDVQRSVQLHNPALVAEVWGIARACVAEETARQARIDTKATSLLATVGLCVSVLAVLMPQSKHEATRWVLAGAAISALLSAGFALYALRVATYERLQGSVIFDAGLLDKADDEEGAKGAARYQRYLLPNMWAAYEQSVGVNDRRASAVALGQLAFGVMLLFVFAGAGLLVFRP